MDTWWCTCIFISCPSLYRRKVSFCPTNTFQWYCLCLCECPFFLQRHVSQRNYDSLICPQVFFLGPVKAWRSVLGVSLWWMNLCLTCYTFEDPYELSSSVKACCHMLSHFVTVFKDNFLWVLPLSDIKRYRKVLWIKPWPTCLVMLFFYYGHGNKTNSKVSSWMQQSYYRTIGHTPKRTETASLQFQAFGLTLKNIRSMCSVGKNN